MPFRKVFEHVLKESEVHLSEDKRGKKMVEVPLKQHYLNSKFDDGRKMYDSPEDLIAATVRTASGKYGVVRSVSKELDADGFPLEVVITTDEDTSLKKGIKVSTEGMKAPQEVRIATVDMNDETNKRVSGLINTGKSDDEIVNILFDPAQYQHSPENEKQVRDLLANIRSTLPKEEQDPSAKLRAQIKNRAIELGKTNNIPTDEYIKSLDGADFFAPAYDEITDEELVDDIKSFNDVKDNPDEEPFEPKEPAEGEEIDWDKELGESKINETIKKHPHLQNRLLNNVKKRTEAQIAQWQKELDSYKQSNDVDQMDAIQHKIDAEQKHLDFINEVITKDKGKNVKEAKKSLANMNVGDLVSWKSHEGVNLRGSGRIIDIWQNKEGKWVATANNSYETVALLDSDLSESKVNETKCVQCRQHFSANKLSGDGYCQDCLTAGVPDRCSNCGSTEDIGTNGLCDNCSSTKESKHKPELKIARYGKVFWITQDGRQVTGPYADIDTAEKEFAKIKESVDEKRLIGDTRIVTKEASRDAKMGEMFEIDGYKVKVIEKLPNGDCKVKVLHIGVTKESKDPEMDFHYVKGYISDMIKNWNIIANRADAFNNIKSKLEALVNAMNESKVNEDIELADLEGRSYKTDDGYVFYFNNAYIEVSKNNRIITTFDFNNLTLDESKKINEDEGLTGNTGIGGGEENTSSTGIVGSEEEKSEEPVVTEPVKAEPKEKAGPVKEYLGNNGASEYFYLVNIAGDDGNVTELQVTDAEEKVIYTTKDSEMDVNDVAGFINSAIKSKEIANISTDILTKYLMPEENPEKEVAEEEDKQAIPEQEPKVESLMKKYGLDKVSELMEKYKLNEEDGVVVEEEPLKVEKPIDQDPVVEEPIGAGAAAAMPSMPDEEAPVEEPKTAEEAKTKIMLEYPEEPFTSLALAFADSLVNNPDVYKQVRQLQYEGQWVNADDFVKMAKVVGELNGFDGTETAKKLSAKFGGDSSKYRIGRDNFVVVDVVVRDMSAAHSLEAVKDLVGATAADDKGEGMVRIQFGRKN
jgi:hypothetical protein